MEGVEEFLGTCQKKLERVKIVTLEGRTLSSIASQLSRQVTQHLTKYWINFTKLKRIKGVKKNCEKAARLMAWVALPPPKKNGQPDRFFTVFYAFPKS